jgi:tetratricopeptide (TPR) repeat protein
MTAVEVKPHAPPADPVRWIYHPAIDLIVGCGAWSAPLLIVAARGGLNTRAWAVAFYLLALAFNYPHYMATVYRAYHTRTEFAKYRLFTVHITAMLAIVAIASHIRPALVPWIFTLYVTWSPWHYTGQNFGLAMMFARRNGVAPTAAERRALYAAFIASYLLLFLNFHTGPSGDPLVLSLGVPPSVSTIARALLLVIAGTTGIGTLAVWMKRVGPAPVLAPFTLAVTQAIWFVVPAIADWLMGAPPMQARYSSGVLAVMHSAQYIWITSYYARREAEGSRGGAWRPVAYAATLVAGGIALFVPGPWLASYLFGSDFTQSVLVFTAIVNIHHFILDGAVWKLRDSRIAALLVDSRPRTADSARRAGAWIAGDAPGARRLRTAALAALVAWAALDQTRFILGTNDRNLSALTTAAALNPYDGSVRRRTLKLLIEQHRYDEAYAAIERHLASHPADGEALLNAGSLSKELGRPDEAVARWEAALDIPASATAARTLLAQYWASRADEFEESGKTDEAARAFKQAIALGEQGGDRAALGADWFNYGQFLRRRGVDARLVVACLIRAEALLAERSDPRAAAVRPIREQVEREQPVAAAAARRSPEATLSEALQR